MAIYSTVENWKQLKKSCVYLSGDGSQRLDPLPYCAAKLGPRPHMGIPPLLFILTNQEPTVAAHNSWRTSIINYINLSINLTNGANSLPQSSWSPSPTPVAIQSVSESTEKTRGPQHAREIPFNLQRVYLDWVTFLPCVHDMWRWRTNQKAFVFFRMAPCLSALETALLWTRPRLPRKLIALRNILVDSSLPPSSTTLMVTQNE